MKIVYKSISIMLAIVVMVNCCLSPVFAAEPDVFDYYPYDTDEDGYITGESEVSTYSAGALLIPVSGGLAGTGGFIAGAGAVVSGVVPVLAVLAAVGLTIYSVHGIVEEATELYNLLSETHQKELTTIYENSISSGDNAFTLSSGLAAGLMEGINKQFYEEEELRTVGLGFSGVNCLQYNYDAQHVYGNRLTSNIYKYELGFNSFTFDGTTISCQQIFNNVGGDRADEQNALSLYNSSTGVHLDFAAYGFPRKYACNKFYISAPVVKSYVATAENVIDGKEYNISFSYKQIGFWVLDECSAIANGSFCEHHTARYQSSYLEDAPITGANASMIFGATGETLLDDIVIDGWQLRDEGTHFVVEYLYDSFVNGVGSVFADVTPLERFLTSEEYVISAQNGISNLVPGQTLYLPGTDVLNNLEYLTKDGATTNTWDTAIDGSTVDKPSTDTGETTSFLQRIIELLESILSKIGGVIIPEWLREIISSLFSTWSVVMKNAWNTFGNFISSNFQYVNGFFERIADKYDELFDFFHNGNEDTEFSKFFSLLRDIFSLIPYPVRSFIVSAAAILIGLAVFKMII